MCRRFTAANYLQINIVYSGNIFKIKIFPICLHFEALKIKPYILLVYMFTTTVYSVIKVTGDNRY
jgi:hypothetical protein